MVFKEGEIELAEQLIGQLSSDSFDPGKYEDEYRQAVLAAVDRKIAGEEVVATAPEAPREKIVDLVAALKKSLAAKQAGKAEPEKAGPGPQEGRALRQPHARCGRRQVLAFRPKNRTG